MITKKYKKTEKRKCIDKLLTIISGECENSGWSWEIDALDEKLFQSAIIRVTKNVSHDTVSALINVLILQDGSIQYSIEKTSFHSYGIKVLFDAIINSFDRAGYGKNSEKTIRKVNEIQDLLPKIFKKFHVAALQLTKRHNGRSSFVINDEFDVQDFMHSILKIHFNDIRPEEYTPSCAGSSSRVDFLLKEEKILVEVKYATSKLKDREIGEQLVIDIEKYSKHPDCENLMCFVYDPNLNIKNPSGLEKDLSKKSDRLNIQVFVFPKE